MRKVLLILAIVALLVSAGIVYLAFSGPRVPSEPFTLQGPLTKEDMVAIATGDTAATLATASPFYAGAVTLTGQRTQVVDDMRAKKIAELLAAATRVTISAEELSFGIDALEKSYLDYLEAVRKSDRRVGPFARASMLQLARDHCAAAAAAACYRALPVDGETPHSTATARYLKVLQAMQAGLRTLRRLDHLSAFAAAAYHDGGMRSDPALQSALATFDAAMGDMDALAKRARALDKEIAGIRHGLRQIETSDYYYARAAVGFLRATLPGVQAKLQALQPRPEFPAAQVAMARDFAADLQAVTDRLQRQLDAADTSRLLRVAATPPEMAVAWAGGSDQRAFFQAAQAYQTKAQREAGRGGDGGAFAAATWQAVKNLPGAAVEMTEFGVKNLMRRALGAWYGSSQEDTEKDITGYANEVNRRFQENRMGTETFRTAKSGMQYLETTCQQRAEALMKESDVPLANSAVGAKVTGLIARGTVSVLTGFAKGVYALCDPTSSSGELAEGTLEVACTMLGGAQMLPTPKLLSNGANKFFAWAGPKVGGALATLAENTVGKRQLYEEVIRRGSPLLVGFLERRIGYATTALLNSTRARLKDELLQMTKSGLLAAGAQARAVAAKTLFDMAKKEFTLGLGGLAQALTTLYGSSMSEFLGVMTGQALDDLLKEVVKETLDGPEGTYAGELSGAASGTLSLVLSSGTVTGSVSGRYRGDAVVCSVQGTVDAGGRIKCTLSGTLTDSQGTGRYPFHGMLTGAAKDGQARGRWSALNEYGGNTGSWSATQ